MKRRHNFSTGPVSDITSQQLSSLASSELRRIGAILATQGKVLEMIAQGEPLDQILTSLCLLIEAELPESLCSILLVNEGHLFLGAGPSLPEDYACGMDGIEIGESLGPCGTSAFRRQTAIFSDIGTSPLLEEFKSFMLEHSVRACWSIPIFDRHSTAGLTARHDPENHNSENHAADSRDTSGEEDHGAVIGTFAISLQEPTEPTEYQHDLLKTAGYLAGIAISRQSSDDERQRLQKDLMHRQKLESLGVMAGGIAHDFNNLLTAIVGSLSMLEVDPGISQASRRRIELAKKASAAATDLTTEMLTYSGLASVELGEVDLVQEIRGVLELVNPTNRPGVSFATSLDSNVRLLHGDASQLRQVVQHLVQNAIDALPSAGGQVRIWLKPMTLERTGELLDHSAVPIPAASYVVFGVEDTGQGIEPGQLGSIFDPFFSSRSSRGLGLAMVLGGSRAHDGFLHVKSAIGQGTTIQVLFPEHRLRHHRSEGSSPSDSQNEPNAEEPRLEVLLVEDEWSIRELIEDILETEGWIVHSASDGLEGWRQWREHHDVDVVVLDRCMPGLSGDELMRRIRREAPGTPIIVTSGFGATSLASLRDEGVDAVLPKPFTANDLLKILQQLTDRPADSLARDSQQEST